MGVPIPHVVPVGAVVGRLSPSDSGPPSMVEPPEMVMENSRLVENRWSSKATMRRVCTPPTSSFGSAN